MDQLTQLGVGGILVILILDRVFAFLRTAKKQELVTAGDQAPDYWLQANKRIATEALETVVAPILRTQTEILERLEARTGHVYEAQLRQGFMLEEANKSLEKVRASNHLVISGLQKLAGS